MSSRSSSQLARTEGTACILPDLAGGPSTALFPAGATDQHRLADGPPDATTLASALQELVSLLSRLPTVLEHLGNGKPPVQRLAYRLDELAAALGMSRRALDRERAADRLPRPDLYVGRMLLFRPETIQSWIASGGKGVS
jgi:hypothetical protein